MMSISIAASVVLLAQTVITIDAARIEGEISPLLHGQFAEFMFEGVKGGLHAELLKNRGFEEAPNAIGLSRYWERYPDDRNDDYGISFRWDDSVAYPVRTELLDPVPVQHSTRITAGRGVIERHGVYQSRIPLRAGIEYHAYVWLKAKDFTGALIAALEQDTDGGRIYAQAAVSDISGEWTRYDFRLKPLDTDPLARFAILVRGQGTLWADQVSLMPGDAVDGVRADVFERIAALRPAFIRWPGGNVAQDYHWQWGTGPRDERPSWINLSWRNEQEPSDFGTDEFLALARRVGAEPTLTVNVEGRGATPEEAAAWVKYANGRVKIWELGNEIWGDWVRGHSDAETYARNFLRYREAMLAVDSSLKFIAVGDNDMSWNRTVLRIAGSYIDYLAIHHYYGFNEEQRQRGNLLSHPLYYEQFYKGVEKLIREVVPKRDIKLAINEWGLDLPEARQHSMDAALYGARMLHVFERSSPFVAMTAVSDMVNGWPGGIIQAGRQSLFVTPMYHVNALYAAHTGNRPVKTTIEGNVAMLDAVTSISADGSRIFLKMVNTDSANATQVRIRLLHAAPLPEAEWQILAAKDYYDHNSFTDPTRIAPEQRAVNASSEFTIQVPKQSVSVLTLSLKPATSDAN